MARLTIFMVKFLALILLTFPRIRWIYIIPLIFYIFINFSKEIFLDWIRKGESKLINNQITRVNGSFSTL